MATRSMVAETLRAESRAIEQEREEGYVMADGELIDRLAEAVGMNSAGEDFDEQLFGRLAELAQPPKCGMRSKGDCMPHHEFRRMVCSRCGGLHWEQPNEWLRFRYCPHCGAEVVG